MLHIISSSKIDIPASAEDWLLSLTHPTVIEVMGRCSREWRAVSVLIHGNEPSGFLAAHTYLKSGAVPEANLAIVICSVRAAKFSGTFEHRYMPGEFDLNRRFGLLDCHDRVTELARHITFYLKERQPSAIIDLHNTSGKSDGFAVAVSQHESVIKLASLFVDKIVVTKLIIGALMEQNFNCPIVTIECGGARQKKSHQLALLGLQKFAEISSIGNIPEQKLMIFNEPVKVKVKQGISLTYNKLADDNFDITLVDDIEGFNSRVTREGELLGWLSRDINDCINCLDELGNNILSTFFDLDENKLIAKAGIQLFMATSQVEMALTDCLFYAVKESV